MFLIFCASKTRVMLTLQILHPLPSIPPGSRHSYVTTHMWTHVAHAVDIVDQGWVGTSLGLQLLRDAMPTNNPFIDHIRPIN